MEYLQGEGGYQRMFASVGLEMDDGVYWDLLNNALNLNVNCLVVTRLKDKFSPGPTTEMLNKFANLAMQPSAPSAEDRKEVGTSFQSLTVLGKKKLNL